MKSSFLAVALSLALAGCTFVGQPSVVSLQKPGVAQKSVPALLKVESVTAPTNAGVNLTVATYNVGRFGETDRQVIQESLEKELARLSGQPKPVFSVSIVFSRYAQAFSNSHGSLGAVVDYAVYAEGKLVFADRFFAARDKGLGITPFGMVKDEFNQRILDRIVADTVAVARGGAAKRQSEATFNELKDALAVLPERVYGETPFAIFAGSPNIAVPWKDLLELPPVTWK